MKMPDWLENDENYKLNTKKDDYVRKNIIRFNSLIKLVQRENVYNCNNEINSSLKILSLILLMILISASRDMYQLWICILFVMIQMSLNSGKIILNILKKSLLMFIFPLIIFIPYAICAPISIALIYYLKIFTMMIEVQMFISGTTIYDIGQSLKQIRCPDVIIFVMDIVIKYLNCTAYLIRDVLQAINIRNVGKDIHKYNTIGGLFSKIFIKVKRCGEELYNAMECRGFTDTYAKPSVKHMSKKDVLFILCHILFIVIYFYVRSYMQ